MLSKKTYIIGAHENYIIGTECVKIYKKISMHKGKSPNFTVRRSGSADNIAKDINSGLLEFNIIKNYDKVIIDTSSLLEITKMVDSEPNNLEDPMDSSEFIMYPFQNYMGLIIPYELKYENENKLVYFSNMLDPVEDYSLFIKQKM